MLESECMGSIKAGTRQRPTPQQIEGQEGWIGLKPVSLSGASSEVHPIHS